MPRFCLPSLLSVFATIFIHFEDEPVLPTSRDEQQFARQVLGNTLCSNASVALLYTEHIAALFLHTDYRIVSQTHEPNVRTIYAAAPSRILFGVVWSLSSLLDWKKLGLLAIKSRDCSPLGSERPEADLPFYGSSSWRRLQVTHTYEGRRTHPTVPTQSYNETTSLSEFALALSGTGSSSDGKRSFQGEG